MLNVIEVGSARGTRRLLGTVVALLSAVLMVAGGSAPAIAHHIPTPPGAGAQFVWPASSWVAANDDYYCCTHHSGSADLASDLFTPVYPARPGVVVRSQFGGGAWGVRIEHDGENGEIYRTQYGHFVDEPEVEVGQQVGLGTLLGYNGRTGNANFSGPHIHFAIQRQNADGEFEPMEIPGLEISTWVESGDYIPGVYAGLTPIEQVPFRTFDVRVTDDPLRVYETTGRSPDGRLADLSAGDVVTVLATHRGQYRIEVGGQLGWIAHSGTLPVDSTVFGVRITSSGNANVRRGPSESNDVIGVVAGGSYVTGYQTSSGWSRVMWPCNANTNRSRTSADDGRALGGCPGRGAGLASYFKYGWVGPAISDRVDRFQARTRYPDLAVFGNTVAGGRNQPNCPCNAGSRIGRVEGMRVLVTVRETFNGWYRVTNPRGPDGWVRGWFTAGRQ